MRKINPDAEFGRGMGRGLGMMGIRERRRTLTFLIPQEQGQQYKVPHPERTGPFRTRTGLVVCKKTLGAPTRCLLNQLDCFKEGY